MQLFTEEFMERARMKTAYREGRDDGIVEGELKTYIGLVRDKLMEPSVAAARLHITESEFMASCDAAANNVF